MMENFKSAAWTASDKCLKAAQAIIGPIWNMLCFKIISAGKQTTKQFYYPLYSRYMHQRNVIQEVLNRLGGHSLAGYALVIGVNAAAMLFQVTITVEICYHFRPYYWKIMKLSTSVIYLGLIVIGRGASWICTFLCTVLCVVWKFLVVVSITLVKFLAVITAQLTSIMVYTISSVLKNATQALNGAFRVSRLFITAEPITDLVTNSWKSPRCGIIIIALTVITTVVLIMLVWYRHKHEKPERLSSIAPPRDSVIEDSTKTVICPDSPLGNCTMGGRCNLKHCSMPYCWQYRESGSQQWRSFDPSVNVAIEKHYCDVEKLEVHVAFRDSHLTLSSFDKSSYITAVINFQEMSMQYSSLVSTQVPLRRLSTPSYIQEPGKKLATKWTWYWKDNDGWKKYAGKKVSSKITQENMEAAYLNDEQVYFFHIDKFNYMITFYEKSMYQRNMNPSYFTKRDVRRRPQFVAESELQSQESFSSYSNLVPDFAVKAQLIRSSYSVEGQETDFKRIPVRSDSEEFQTVKTLFHKTIPPRKAQISSLEKIKNDFLRERYERKRDQMKKKLKVSNYNKIEKQLFHGTTTEVIDAICKQNFDHRLHGKNGTKYGEGSYFAVKASYSNNYSSGQKTRFMFLASVLTGEFTVGKTRLRRPPLKDPSNPASDLYDSCVDNEDDPTIFVIFNDEQCYPSYLITYNVL